MNQIRISTLKLVRKFPFSQVTAISCIQKIDYSRHRSYPELSDSTLNFGRKYDVQTRREFGKLSFDLGKIRKDAVSILSEVKMKDLANAPTPAFWYGVSGLVPVLGIPVLFLLTGYCHSFATVQLTCGATICAFLGGVRWGYAVPDGSSLKPTWENLGWSLAPQVIAWFGLLLPQSLGLLAISSGLAMAAFMDLTTVKYPPWFKSLRLFLTIPAIFGLLLTFLMRPFA